MAVSTGANGLMPEFTYGFGEGVKVFYGALADVFISLFPQEEN